MIGDAEYNRVKLGTTRIELTKAARKVAELESQNTALREALEDVMTGGNHLASHLIDIGKGKMPNDYASYGEARRIHGIEYADVWICWRKIMDARPALADTTNLARSHDARVKAMGLREFADAQKHIHRSDDSWDLLQDIREAADCLEETE